METATYNPSITPYRKIYTVLQIANHSAFASIGGVHAYDDSINVHLYDNRIVPYFGDLVESGVVVDKRPCLKQDNYYWIEMRSPALMESLPSGFKYNIIWDPDVVEACDNVFSCASTDYVALNLYLDFWRSKGARIGKRVANSLEWEDGEVFAIPSEENRFNCVD